MPVLRTSLENLGIKRRTVAFGFLLVIQLNGGVTRRAGFGIILFVEAELSERLGLIAFRGWGDQFDVGHLGRLLVRVFNSSPASN